MRLTPRNRTAPAPTTAGFGLIELMVSLLVIGLLMLAMFSVFFRSSDEQTRMSQLVEFRQSARASVQLFERDMRMAGSGWGREPVEVGTNSQWYAIDAGPGAGPNDSITIFGAWGSQTTLSQPMNAVTDPIRVRGAPPPFAVGDLIVVSDKGGITWNLFQVTGTADSTVQHATTSLLNPSVTPGVWPTSGYPKGSLVYRASRLTYRVDSLNFGRPCLVRQEFNGQPQAVAYDLNRFQIWYRMQDNSLTRDPMGWGVANGYANGRDYIAQVQPRIIVRVTGRNRPTLLDSVWAEVRPRSF